MSDAFEILSAALKEAIDDAQNPILPRRFVETKPPRPLKRFKRIRALKRSRKNRPLDFIHAND